MDYLDIGLKPNRSRIGPGEARAVGLFTLSRLQPGL